MSPAQKTTSKESTVAQNEYSDAAISKVADSEKFENAQDHTNVQKETKLPRWKEQELKELALLERYPELKLAVQAKTKRQFSANYGNIEKLLGVDQKTGTRILDLCHERLLVQFDVNEIQAAQGGMTSEQRAVAIRQEVARVDAEIQQILTPSQYDLLKIAPTVRLNEIELEKNIGSQLRRLGGESGLSMLPIALAMARNSVVLEGKRGDISKIDPQSFLTPGDMEALKEVSSDLNAEQLNALKAWRREQNVEIYYRSLEK